MKHKDTIIYIFFYILLLFCICYISWWYWALRFIISVCLYFIIFYLCHIIWKKIRKVQSKSIQDYSIIFLKKIASLISLMLLIIWWFCVYQNILFPAKLPLYTLSNGKQTIEFQTMSHIASGKFYRNVKENITKAKKDWFVLYFEWVRPGNTENTQAFNEALGIKFEAWIYNNLSKLYGIEAQNNSDFLWLVNKQDYNIDLSIDEIMEQYNSINIPQRNRSSSPAFDINQDILETLSTIRKRELSILRFINQAFLNFIMKNDSFRNSVISKLWNTNLFDVILDERNAHIVSEVYQKDDAKIFLIYGLMHFEWVLELLKQQDPNWKIVKSQDFQAIYSL